MILIQTKTEDFQLDDNEVWAKPFEKGYMLGRNR